MRRETWKVFAALVAVVALAASNSVLAAKKKTPTPAASADASSASPAASKTEKVNLNTADEKAIAGAKGVGAKLAAELVKGRPYRTWDDVSKVKGVGSGKKLDALKGVLKLTEGVGAPAAAKTEPAAEKKETKTRSSSKGSEAAAPVAPQAAAPAAGPGVASGAGSGASPSSPSKKSESSSSSSSSSAKKTESAPKIAPGTKININTATKEQLDALPEIGPVKAQAIVDYRKANGNFAAPEDIMKVPGIKEGTFAKIKDYVVVR